MRLHEDAIVPGILGACEGAFTVVKLKVSNNLRACRIRGADIVVSAKKSVRLIKIGGPGNIGGDRQVIFAWVADAVHLKGEEHRDANLFPCPRHIDGVRPAPTLATEDDCRPP